MSEIKGLLHYLIEISIVIAVIVFLIFGTAKLVTEILGIDNIRKECNEEYGIGAWVYNEDVVEPMTETEYAKFCNNE